MDPKNAAIIGCGAIGPIHAAAITASEGANLYAVCDQIEERASVLAQKYGCKVLSLEQILLDPKVDCVHICTPHYLHGEMAIQVAQAGKHIVLEKPVALHVKEASQVYQAVENHGVQCCVVLQNRLNPSIQMAKQYIEAGTLGKLLGIKGFLTWKRTAAYYQSESWRGKWATEGGGLLINQAVHMLDMLYYLGGEVEAVKGNIDTRVLYDTIEVEDTADATLYFKDDMVGLFYATNCNSQDSPFFIEIHLEKGLLRYMDKQLTLKTEEEEKVLVRDDGNALGKAYWGSGHAELINCFYQNIAGCNVRYSTLRDAAYSMGLLDGIYASAKSRKKEKVEIYGS